MNLCHSLMLSRLDRVKQFIYPIRFLKFALDFCVSTSNLEHSIINIDVIVVFTVPGAILAMGRGGRETTL